MSVDSLRWHGPAPLWGGWCSIPSAATAEILARCGYDWVGIDYQHGAMSLAVVDHMVQVLNAARVPAFVRVSSALASAEICKVLDFGARGIIVPVVNSAAEARSATQACRYAPDGIRSWAGLVARACAVPKSSHPRAANAHVKCVVMIETVEAVESIDEILSVPGIDAVFVGPSDLAHSAGLPPSLFADDPAHVERVAKVLRAAKAASIVPGIYAGTVEAAGRWLAHGARFMALSDDSTLLTMAARSMTGQARAVSPAKE